MTQAGTTTDRSLAGREVAVVNWRDLGHRLAGGAEVYAWHAACALRDAGARVVFVTSRDAGQGPREVVDGIEVVRRGGPLTYYLHAAWQLWRRRRRLDLVVDPECGVPSFAPLWVRRSTPVVLVVHHVHLDQFETYFRWPVSLVGQLVERRLMPRLYAGARTVAVSTSTVDDMRTRLGWRGPVDVVPNGTVAVPADGPAPSGSDRAGAAEERLLVLGRLVPHKRVDAVLRAVATVLPSRPHLRVDVAGQGPERERLEQLAAELGLQDVVTFHGFVPDDHKTALIEAARLQVCASDVEGWGQVVLEAAAHGVPTLARDVPGLRESVNDDLTGWLLDEDEPALDAVSPRADAEGALVARLAAGLHRALDDLARPARPEQLARACRSWAAGFSWDRMHDQVVTIALEELRGTRTPPHDSQPGATGRGTTTVGACRPEPVRTPVPGRTER